MVQKRLEIMYRLLNSVISMRSMSMIAVAAKAAK